MIFQVGSASVDMLEGGDRVVIGAQTKKAFEPETLEVWGRLCMASKGRTMLDVGAYTGLFAISAAMMGCGAVAFEPLEQNGDRLLENADRNHADVYLQRLAISDFIGTASFSANPSVPFTSGGSLLSTKFTPIEVDVVTLDYFHFEDVAAIKIDVERAEPGVLRGAAATLERCRPTLIVEVLGADERQPVRDAVPGYEVAEVLDGRNWLMVPR